MAKENATDGLGPVHPFALRPGQPLRVMPMRFDQQGSTRPWSKLRPFVEFRAEQRAALEAASVAELLLRARLDWAAHVPAARSEPEPEPEPAAPVAPPVRDLADIAAQVAADQWRGAEASARRRAEAGELNGLPTAAGYATWTDEQLEALGVDPDDGDLDDGDSVDSANEEWDDESVDVLDVHPVYLAVDEVEQAQRRLREAEAVRVQAAVSAWRVAEASVTGTPGTSVDGTYFASVVMDIAFRLQVAERTATSLITSAMALEATTPECWRLFTRGEVPWRAMQMLHARLDGLDEEHWAAFDAKAAEVLTTVALPKLKKRLRTIRERIQSQTAAERHEKARLGMRVTIEPLDDGMVEIIAVVPAPEGVSMDQRLHLAATAAAAVEGETRSIAELRAHILLDVFDEGLFRGATPGFDDLAVPTRRGVQAKVGVLVPIMTVLGHSDVPATLEGYGPIDIETAKRLLGTATSFFRVLTDEHTGIVKDIGRTRYRPTAEMRTFLGIVDGGGRGPNSDRPPSRTEIDHVRPFRQRLARGRTALDNLVLLATRDHRIKTSGLWDIQLLPNRDLVWTSFFGTRIITTVESLEPTPIPERFRDSADPVPCPF